MWFVCGGPQPSLSIFQPQKCVAAYFRIVQAVSLQEQVQQPYEELIIAQAQDALQRQRLWETRPVRNCVRNITSMFTYVAAGYRCTAGVLPTWTVSKSTDVRVFVRSAESTNALPPPASSGRTSTRSRTSSGTTASYSTALQSVKQNPSLDWEEKGV